MTRLRNLTRRSGFALTATLLMMMLLVMIALGLLSLSSVSLRTSGRETAIAGARSNARLALALALAQLQKQSGPDNRITAPADFVAEGDPASLANAAWRGVWRSNPDRPASYAKAKADFFLEWLVTHHPSTSSLDAVRTAVRGDSVVMRNAGATPEVRVPLLPVADRGRIGWWTDDESTKARADLPLIEPAAEGERMVARHAPGRLAPEAVPGVEDFEPTARNAAAAITPGQLPLAAGKWPDATGRSFTPYSRSVIADVRQGGLKADLSALFEQSEDRITDFGNWRGALNSDSAKSYLYGAPGVAIGARWNQLYQYYNLYRNVRFNGSEPQISPPAPPIDWNKADSGVGFGDEAGGFRYPRLAKIVYLFSYSSVRNPNPPAPDQAFTLRLITDIYVTFWNPFDVRIVFPANATAYAKFSKALPLKFDWRINGTQRGTIGLEDMITATDLFVTSPFYRPGAGAQFTMAPGETVTFSIRDPDKTDFYPGAFFEGGVKTDTLLSGGRKLSGKAADRISVGLLPSEHGNAPSSQGLLTSQYLDFWIYDTLRKRPYYEHRGEIIAKSDAQFLSWMPPVPATRVPSVSFSQVLDRKQPFAAFIMETKTASESLYPVPAFLTTGTTRLSSQLGNNAPEFMNERLEYKIEAVSGFDSDLLQVTLPSHPAGPDHGFIGSGRGPGTGQTRFVFSSIPSEPPTSLAQFRHAGTGDGASAIRATGWGFTSTPNSPYADQAIGNSYAHPMLAPDTAADGNLLDNRYLGNEALWDGYFLSSLAPQDAARFGKERSMEESWKNFLNGQGKLVNPRFSPWLGGRSAESILQETFSSGTPAADAYRKIAAHLLLEGGFNVNSTSVEAWQAFLASTRQMPLIRLPLDGGSGGKSITSTGTLFSRTNTVLAGSVDDQPGDLATHYAGYRDLPDDSLRTLAEKIVDQVRKRGPFLSVSEFVNRRLTHDSDLALSGALQTAIDEAGLNAEVARAGSSTSGSPGGVTMAFPAAAELGGAAGNPGWLMQADLLDPLGSAVVVRGDTFRIRAYGEFRDDMSTEPARAWCEAVVQRTPGFIDPGESPESHPITRPLNLRFGRGYRIVSFRWLAGPEG